VSSHLKGRKRKGERKGRSKKGGEREKRIFWLKISRINPGDFLLLQARSKRQQRVRSQYTSNVSMWYPPRPTPGSFCFRTTTTGKIVSKRKQRVRSQYTSNVSMWYPPRPTPGSFCFRKTSTRKIVPKRKQRVRRKFTSNVSLWYPPHPTPGSFSFGKK